MQYRTVPIAVEQLGDREVAIRMMTRGLKDDGYDLLPRGCNIEAYSRNPIQLWQHNPEHPIGVNDRIMVDDEGISARCRFADAGISTKADEICGLVKTGVLRALSIGFHVRKREQINPKDPRAGYRALEWDLYECSFVSTPLDTEALVTARELGSRAVAEWKVGASRDFPIQDGDPAWDGGAAEKAIFEWAGGDEFDPAKAREAFLAYDASAPELRGSYKLPFANIIDGEPKVPKAALRAASGAHGVQAADIGDAKDSAQAVLDHYKEKAGMTSEEGGRSSKPRRARRVQGRSARAPQAMIRGMWGVAQLAYIVDCVSDAKCSAEIEQSMEGDQSRVPAMLAAALKQLGDALIEMTTEEVEELLADGEDIDATVVVLDDDDRARVNAAKTPALRAFLAGLYRARSVVTSIRAGAALSAANADKLGTVDGHHGAALDKHREAGDLHAAVGEHHDGLIEAHARAVDSHEALGAALDSEEGDDRKRAYRSMGRALDDMGERMGPMQDDHEAQGDAHKGIGRSVRAARRVLRSIDGAATADGEGPLNSQGSAGLVDGKSRAVPETREARERDLDLLRLGRAAA